MQHLVQHSHSDTHTQCDLTQDSMSCAAHDEIDYGTFENQKKGMNKVMCKECRVLYRSSTEDSCPANSSVWTTFNLNPAKSCHIYIKPYVLHAPRAGSAIIYLHRTCVAHKWHCNSPDGEKVASFIPPGGAASCAPDLFAKCPYGLSAGP